MDRSVQEPVDHSNASNSSSDAQFPGPGGGHQSGSSTPLSVDRVLSRNANGTIAMTSQPTNESELQLYRVLQRANLLAYYDTFICQGGDDVQQLCEAGEEEFLEIMALVGMASKPLHVRRLQKALQEWVSNPAMFQTPLVPALPPSHPNHHMGGMGGGGVSRAGLQGSMGQAQPPMPMRPSPPIPPMLANNAHSSPSPGHGGSQGGSQGAQKGDVASPSQMQHLHQQHQQHQQHMHQQHQQQHQHHQSHSTPQSSQQQLQQTQQQQTQQQQQQQQQQPPPPTHSQLQQMYSQSLPPYVMNMSEDDPRRMDEIRKYAAIYGRFDTKRKPEKPLTLHEPR